MNPGDDILRAHAIITSLRSNVPNDYEIEEAWVRKFNGALRKIESSLNIDLEDFKVADDELYRSVASSNYVTGDVRYRDGLWCRRETLLHRIDSVLGYFDGLQSGRDRHIGFTRS